MTKSSLKGVKNVYSKVLFSKDILRNSFYFYYGAGQIYCKSGQRLLQIWADLLQIRATFTNGTIVTNWYITHVIKIYP